ncbi:DUF397 domain-containing protein [Streptomyces sp. NBC_01477]|uniref:DUF397 domain-containing protein n=1 Tax=Streptomyces sp. NBC_01477 TaxID=2976015 RepID=UPI002E303002|nr:DUF397 domain-containing protein [Streptomyces sp. NBC_01477]
MTEHVIANSATRTGWRKSSYSGTEAGSCVEILDNHSGGIPVRDSKDPHGPALLFPQAAWSSFISAVKSGDLPA